MILIRQTFAYVLTNAASAAFGLLNVVIFTRLVSASDYGIYVIGMGLAAIFIAVHSSWLRLAVLQHVPKGGEADFRGTALAAFGVAAIALPPAYWIAQGFFGLPRHVAAMAVFLALTLGFFEVSLELLRAGLRAKAILKWTLVRVILVSGFGIVTGLWFGGGLALLLSTGLAYLASCILLQADTWWGFSRIRHDGLLREVLIKGLPVTASFALLAVSTTADRFMLAGFQGAAAAGQYGASVDLVRQALMMPAVSAASAFMPMAVRLLAQEGTEATRSHLEDCLELLLAIMLPACIGYALVSHEVADLVLGPGFRTTAHEIMGIVAISVIFQVFTQQYAHIGFMLANRNVFYMVHTALTLIVGLVASFLLIKAFGIIGAAWARVANEIIAAVTAVLLCRRAFAMPLPVGRVAKVVLATLCMASSVAWLQHILPSHTSFTLGLLIMAGAVIYVAACWSLDVAKCRAIFEEVVMRLSGNIASAPP